MGVHGLLVFPISAYQGTPLDPEVPVRYHAAIGDASGLPLILFQLQPALGGVNFEPETLSRLCTVAEVVAIKSCPAATMRLSVAAYPANRFALPGRP